MNQEEIFAITEANNWFLRNSEFLDKITCDQDQMCIFLKKQDKLSKINSVLELGCSTGYRLNLLRNLLPNCHKYVGMDLSNLAIKYGKEKYGLELYQDSLHTFSYPEQFDLVIVNFLLCWIDRDLLYQCVSKIDNLLKSQNAFLLLGDFFPYKYYKKKYHHVYIYIYV